MAHTKATFAGIMKAYTIFQQYIWLVNTIHNAGKISLEDLNKRWVETEIGGGAEMARSTFNRHRSAIEDMFGLIIECDRSDGFRYYISNPEALKDSSVSNWMLSTLTVGSMVSDNRPIQDRILMEPVPTTGSMLKTFMDAMRAGVRVRIRYRRYGEEEEKTMVLDPYCAKMFRRRWYAVVKFPAVDSIFALAFDRILEVELTGRKFSMDRSFNAEEFFSECFGIVHDSKVPLERVVIRAFGSEADYMRDLPLHHSQKEVLTSQDFSDFELLLRPTSDILEPLLGRGAAIRVMQPQWLADRLRERLKAALSLYETNE